ncbi:MAG: hypothetical protein LBH07_04825 [Treponema sp.]|jgi:hypothetical protein|nr:hypothetical protein [Treponema sp.]
MAKKGLLVFILVVVVSGAAFAQFFVSADVDISRTMPAIGFGFCLPNFDLLAGFEFEYHSPSWEHVNDTYWDASISETWFRVFAGIAPKVALAENWTLSFPLLLRFSFAVRPKTDFATDVGTSGLNNDDAGFSHFGVAFRPGMRAAYGFTEHWSLYGGFLVDMVSWSQWKHDTWKGNTVSVGTKENYTYKRFDLFNYATIHLGVSYRF